jgi:hypothetical protein
LAKFCGLIIKGKYGAVIGRETHILYVPNINFHAMGFLANHSAVFTCDHQTTDLTV